MTDENTSEPVGSGPRYRIYSRMPDDTWQGSGTGGPFDRFDTAMWFVKREENRWPKEIFRITAFKGDVVYETDAAPAFDAEDAHLLHTDNEWHKEQLRIACEQRDAAQADAEALRDQRDSLYRTLSNLFDATANYQNFKDAKARKWFDDAMNEAMAKIAETYSQQWDEYEARAASADAGAKGASE